LIVIGHIIIPYDKQRGLALLEPISIEDRVKLSSVQQGYPSRSILQTIAPVCLAQTGAISLFREVIAWQEENCDDWMNSPGKCSLSSGRYRCHLKARDRLFL
jgi:hypothetical protein